jgi:hypothetical protein
VGRKHAVVGAEPPASTLAGFPFAGQPLPLRWCIHHPIHGRMRPVLDLDPTLRPAGLIRPIAVRAKRSLFPIGIVDTGAITTPGNAQRSNIETNCRQKHKSAPELLALLQRALRSCLFE